MRRADGHPRSRALRCPLLLAGSAGTSMRSGCRRPARASAVLSPQRGQGRPLSDERRVRRGRPPPRRASCRRPRRARAGDRRCRPRPERSTETRARQREPLPSTCSRSRPRALWSSMASPTARPGCPERSRATIASRSGGRARMSGPTRRTARWFSSRTGPFTCTASSRSPRRTSQGRPRIGDPRGREPGVPACADDCGRRRRPRSAAGGSCQPLRRPRAAARPRGRRRP